MFGLLVDRVFVFCASLKLAVATLSLLASVLALATFYEARYGTDAVQLMVYQAPWFAALLAVLAINIFAAAIIRLPWKRHQTGFVITHVGLLVLLFGCVFGFHRSVDGLLAIEEGQSGQAVRLKREHLMVRYRGSTHQAQSWLPLNLPASGPYPSLWRYALSPLLGSPGKPHWPQGQALALAPAEHLDQAAGRPVRFSVVDWYPAARAREGFIAGSRSDGPAVQVLLEGELPNVSAAAAHRGSGALAQAWVHLPPNQTQSSQRLGPLEVRLLRLGDDPRQLEAFMAYDAAVDLPTGVRGLLEIAQTQAGTLVARRLSQRGLEWADQVEVGKSYPAFMSMTFRLGNHLPHATAGGGYEPLDLPPSKPGVPAALLRVSVGDRVHDLWLARDGMPRPVDLGEQRGIMTVTYGVDHLPLPFRLQVDRFERGVDPGTDNAASFASQVRVLDEQGQTLAEARIAMNEPLQHGGLTFYQSGFQKMPSGRTMTILAVNRDPGRPIKYVGSLLIVLGIFTMFYMRAYFFQPRNRSAEQNTGGLKAMKPATTLAAVLLVLALGGGARAEVAEAAVHAAGANVKVTLPDPSDGQDHALALVPHAPRLNPATLEALRRMPVLHDGRVKPLDTVATQIVRQVTGRARFGAPVDQYGELTIEQRYDPVELMLAWMSDPPAWSSVPLVQVQRLELREFLGMPATHSHVSPAALGKHDKFATLARELFSRAAKAEMSGESFTPSPFEDAVLDVARREGHFRAACHGAMLGLLAYPDDPAFFAWLAEQDQAERPAGAVARAALGHWRLIDPELDAALKPSAFLHRAGWLNLHELLSTDPQQLPPPTAERWTEAGRLWAGALHAYRNGQDMDAAVLALVQQWPSVAGVTVAAGDLERELAYNRAHPFRWAMALYLLAAVLLLAALQVRGKAAYVAGLVCIGAAIAVHVWGFYLRIRISGWAPVTNMYETVIWVSLVCAIFGLALEAWYRWRLIALSAAVVAALCALVADIMPPNLGAEIRSLQPVLRSNFWLTTHVLTIVSSYAAFALALGLGNIALGFHLWAPHRRDVLRHLTLFIYRALQIGVLLVAAGTILGGVWADQSWGRFWGWDPKEVWALIVLLVYLVILHGRFAGWIGPFGLAAGSVLGFVSVIMAWYGVNFVLGVGLHSYGFGAGGRAEVFTGVLVQCLFVAVAWWRHRLRAAAAAEQPQPAPPGEPAPH